MLVQPQALQTLKTTIIPILMLARLFGGVKSTFIIMFVKKCHPVRLNIGLLLEMDLFG